MHQILEVIRSFDDILELAPGEGSEFPELAWGDHFFYYAPDGQIPQNVQPYATIVTKDYPDDRLSMLDASNRWRLNIHVGRVAFTDLTGSDPRSFTADGHDAVDLGVDRVGFSGVDSGRHHFSEVDFSETDAIMPHPVYGSLGWVAVVNPGDRTMTTVVELLRSAHARAKARVARREA